MTTHAGHQGVKSDCYVEFTPENSGGIDIEINSKVKAMYEESIFELAKNLLAIFNIENGKLYIDDQGALPFTLAARIETALKRAISELDKTYQPEIKEYCTYSSSRERLRRSRLYLPGNNPKFFPNAGLHKPDGVILDLEDSVHPQEKDAARTLIRNSLCSINFYGAERMARINPWPIGQEDLSYLVAYNIHLILIPKCENAEEVIAVDEEIRRLKEQHGIKNDIFLMPIIESALGIENAYKIARASSNNVALTIGLEDYTADIGAEKTYAGKESLYARSVIINAARAAHLQPIDSVFSDVEDMEKLQQSAQEGKKIGFEGKGCIHPRQIKVINEAFLPDAQAIKKAVAIANAFYKAEKAGQSVVALGSKMIDPPVVKRAMRVIETAVSAGKLDKNWQSDNCSHGKKI